MVSQASSETKYDMDDGPLTSEMVQVLDAVEAAQTKKQVQATPAHSPHQGRTGGSARKRQRGSPSPSELILSTRLRGSHSLKATSRAELAGLTPKSNHALRRDDSSPTPTNAKHAPSTDSNVKRSQSTGPNPTGSEGLVDHGAFPGPMNPYYHTYSQSGPHLYAMMQQGHPQPHGGFPPSGLPQTYHTGAHFPHAAAQPFLHPGSGYPQGHPAGISQDYAHGSYAGTSSFPPFVPPIISYNPGTGTAAPSARPVATPGSPSSDYRPPVEHILPEALALDSSSDHPPIDRSKAHSESVQPRRASNPSPAIHPPVQTRPRPQSEAPVPTTDTLHSKVRSADGVQGNSGGSVQPRSSKSLNFPMDGPDASNDIFSPKYLPPPGSDLSHGVQGKEATDSCAMDTPRQQAGPSGPAVPSIAVQSSTPALFPKTSAVSGISDSPSWNDGLDDDEDVGYERLDGSPTVGRLSTAKSEALKKGLAKIDASFKDLGAETGLSVSQIIDRWQLVKFRLPTLWNIYQQYFVENSEEELARLPQEQRPRPGALYTVQNTSDCYKYFKAAHGKAVYGKKLQTWYQLHSLSTTDDMTVAQRERQFGKLDDKIQNLGRYYSTHFGFEMITIMVGSVINQDQNLGKLIMTPGAVDLFQERFRATDDVVLSHMKAHVYDRISKQIIAEGDDQPRMQLPTKSKVGSSTSRPSLNIEKSSARISTSRAQSIQPPSRSVSSVKAEVLADVDLSEPDKLESTQLIAILRKKFEDLGEEHNLAIMKATGGGQRLQWKPLLQITSAEGYVFVNWPEGVDFPGDQPSNSKKALTKGIASLSRKALLSLFAAFDHPTHPLRLEKRYDDGVPADQPVVIGAPPDADSAHSRGRRKFLDEEQNEDRQGPPRLTSTRSSKRRAKSTTRKASAPPTRSKKKSKIPIDDFIVEEEEEEGQSVASYSPEEEDEYDDDDIEEPSPKRLRSSKARAQKDVSPEKEEEGSHDEEEQDVDKHPLQNANTAQDSRAPSRPSAASEAGASSKTTRDHQVPALPSTLPAEVNGRSSSTKPVERRTAGSPSARASTAHSADTADRADRVAQGIFGAAESQVDAATNHDSHAPKGVLHGSSVMQSRADAASGSQEVSHDSHAPKGVLPGNSVTDSARPAGNLPPPQYPYFAPSGPYNWPSHMHPWQQPPDQQQPLGPPSGPGRPHPSAYNHGAPQYMFNGAPGQAPFNHMPGGPYQNYPYYHHPPPQGPQPPHWNNDQHHHTNVASSSGRADGEFDKGDKGKKFASSSGSAGSDKVDSGK